MDFDLQIFVKVSSDVALSADVFDYKFFESELQTIFRSMQFRSL